MKGTKLVGFMVAMAIVSTALCDSMNYQINRPNLDRSGMKNRFMKKSTYVTVTNNAKMLKTVKVEKYRLASGVAGAADMQTYSVNPGESTEIMNLPASHLSKIVFKEGHLDLKYLRAEDKASKTLYVDNDKKKAHTIAVFLDGALLEEAMLAKHMTGGSKKEYDLTNRQVSNIVCTGAGKTRIDLITKQ